MELLSRVAWLAERALRMGGSWIRELSIENFGLIQATRLELTPGFNVVTGESGAGKSMLVTALDIAFGARAQSDQVGVWGDRARVRVALALSEDDPVWTTLGALDILPDEVLLIQREWGRDGRSLLRLQGQVVPLSVGRAALAGLVELSGQHEHQRLGEPRFARVWLDEWVDPKLVATVASVWSERIALLDERTQLEALRGDRALIEEWREQVAALEALEIDPVADGRLAERVARARGARQLAEWYEHALHDLEVAVSALADGHRALADARAIDSDAASSADLVADAQALAGEARHQVYRRLELFELETDVTRFVERLDQLARARRRYDTDLEGLLAILAARRTALAAAEEAEFRLSRLAQRESDVDARYEEAAGALSAARAARAEAAARAVTAVLPDLDLPDAVFGFHMRSGPAGPHGVDEVSWVFAANPGQEPRPLHRVASGGERARVLLALNMVRRTAGALVFDEVDAGLGGHAAARVASVLAELARRQQLVVVSHQALVAARAERHWRIVKESGAEGASRLTRLDGARRVEEIARMLSGSATPVALSHAADLLAGTGGESAG